MIKECNTLLYISRTELSRATTVKIKLEPQMCSFMPHFTISILLSYKLLNPKKGVINLDKKLAIHPPHRTLSCSLAIFNHVCIQIGIHWRDINGTQPLYCWFSWTRGDRGIREGFSSLTSNDSYVLFSRNSSRRFSTGIARSDSMVPLLGTSGSLLDGVAPVGS